MSAYRIMWLIVMFDLPTKTAKERKQYRWLSKYLESKTYIRLQYSVYAKVFNSVQSANYGKKRLKEFLRTNVKNGNVRILMFTDAQFGKMEIIIGEKSTQEEISQKTLFDF